MSRPWWRWALFCALIEAHCVLNWRWLSDVWAWCILPEWLGVVDGMDTASVGDGEPPW